MTFSDTDCSIAHSGEFVVGCVGYGYRTGIDIEKMKPVDYQGIAATIPQLTTLVPDCTASQENFFDAWTMLEALLKAHGKGFGADIQINKLIDNRYQTGSETWHVEKITIEPEYACHLAYADAENSQPVIELNHVEIEELLQTSREMVALAGGSTGK
jgi:4'-phosphopantetheinyl transferase